MRLNGALRKLTKPWVIRACLGNDFPNIWCRIGRSHCHHPTARSAIMIWLTDSLTHWLWSEDSDYTPVKDNRDHDKVGRRHPSI